MHADEMPWKQIALFLVTLAVLIVCAFILQPFFSAIVGAIVLAVVTQRPYEWLQAKMHNRSAGAALTLVLVIASVITPVFFIGQHLGGQLADIVTTLRSDATQVKISDYFGRHPSLAGQINAITASIDLPRTAQTATAYIGSKLAGFLGSSFSAITQIVVMLFILFFLYRDGELAISFVRSLLPLGPEESNRLMGRVRDTIYATALGRLAIAGIQALLVGLAYWRLGVPNYLFWAILTGVMAMVPAFGAFLVWVPVALYLGLTGHWGKAALLAVWGGGVVSTIDNFLYPILIGPRLQQHTVAVLISILGGIALFGITGIVLGPVTFTVASTLLDMWKTRTSPSTENL